MVVPHIRESHTGKVKNNRNVLSKPSNKRYDWSGLCGATGGIVEGLTNLVGVSLVIGQLEKLGHSRGYLISCIVLVWWNPRGIILGNTNYRGESSLLALALSGR